MFKVKVVNSKDKTDICLVREYEEERDAEKYYNLFKNSMIANKDAIFRPYNEELEQSELRYCDVKLFLLDGDKEISRFFIG